MRRPAHAARGGVAILDRDQVLRGLLHDLPAVATTDDRDLRAHIVDARSTAFACACSICSRCHGSASAHTADTDFGALNVKSIPPPRPPSAPAGRNHRPVRDGGLPSAPRNQRRHRPSAWIPRRLSVAWSRANGLAPRRLAVGAR